ncbi:hypothetical protein E0H46_31890 [Rhizobium leguminosarum bv. viciae]|nr:hypothetical protein E0H46_31890 [Rhizobium leguminosarum bv. viciae]
MKKFNGGSFSIPSRLKKMGYESYGAYLKSEHWKGIKKNWFWSKCYKGDKCSVIGCDEVYGLDLHHKHYFNLGAEQNGDLVLICNRHHGEIHKLEKSGLKLTKATYKVLGRSRNT